MLNTAPILKAELQRKKRRLEKLLKSQEDMQAKHSGNEAKLTYHAGFDLGYIKGKISEMEDFIDFIEEVLHGEDI